MLVKKTTKLFYGKYPYKIETKVKGASSLLRRGYNYILDFCNSNRSEISQSWTYRGVMFSKIDKDILLEYAETIKPYLEKDNEIKKRTEGSVISFFIEDKPTYDKISQHMFRWISEVHEPGSQEDLDFLLANGAKKILVDEIPYGKYNYKVTLKCDLAVNRRSDFFSWLSKYTEDTFKVSKETARWLKNERKWSADPFIYVSNSSMLTMMGMYVSGHIRRIDQYVLRSSIHTE